MIIFAFIVKANLRHVAFWPRQNNKKNADSIKP